jgi:hypothetical protein
MTMITATTVLRQDVRAGGRWLIAMALARFDTTATTTPRPPPPAPSTACRSGGPAERAAVALGRRPGPRADVYAAAGGTWLRIDVDWSIIEHEGPLLVVQHRLYSRAAAARGLSVRRSDLHPSRGPRRWHHARPAHQRRGLRLLRRCRSDSVRRTDRAYDLEQPNNPLFWAPGANVAGYVTLLKAAYPAVKTADPDAIVLGGSLSLAPTAVAGFPVTFTSMYASGPPPHGCASGAPTVPALPSDPTTASGTPSPGRTPHDHGEQR